MGVDGRIILKRILKKWNVEEWIGFIWLTVGTRGDFYERGNKPFFYKTHWISWQGEEATALLHGVSQLILNT